MTKEVDQVVGGAVQQQAKSIGQEAVTAQAVGAETVLELLDAVLTLAAVVVESEDLGGTSGAVGNHEAQVGSGGRLKRRYRRTQVPQRSFTSFRHRARSWPRQRRICYKAEHTVQAAEGFQTVVSCR